MLIHLRIYTHFLIKRKNMSAYNPFKTLTALTPLSHCAVASFPPFTDKFTCLAEFIRNLTDITI